MNEVVGVFSSEAIDMGDIQEFWEVVQRTFLVHDDRERVRHGLWKKYTALDQMRQVKIKTERVIHGLEQDGHNELVLPELPDIINYSIFAHRIIQGRI